MDFFGIGPLELFFVIIVALMVLGPAKMLETMRNVGKAVGQLTRVTSELPRLIEREVQEAEQRTKEETEPPLAEPGDSEDEEADKR